MTEPHIKSHAGTATFTWNGIWRGFRAGQPLGIGAFVYGVAFGLVARQASISVAEALLMSAVIYSGSGQLAAVSIISQSTPWASANLWLIAVTIMIVNARYVLYGAAMRPWLASVPPLKSYGSLFILADGNWILSMKAHAAGERDAGFFLGSGLAMFTPWLAGTLLGASAGSLVPNPKALGLDFLLVAFSAAAAVAMAKSRNDVWTVAAAAAIALAVQQFVPGGWPIVAAGIAGAIVGYVRWKPAGSAVQ
jgi:predicted branched-subunit amino acid permease